MMTMMAMIIMGGDDDAFVQAWHDGSETRVVLIFDLWHPDFSAEEVKFLNYLQKSKLKCVLFPLADRVGFKSGELELAVCSHFYSCGGIAKDKLKLALLPLPERMPCKSVTYRACFDALCVAGYQAPLFGLVWQRMLCKSVTFRACSVASWGIGFHTMLYSLVSENAMQFFVTLYVKGGRANQSQCASLMGPGYRTVICDHITSLQDCEDFLFSASKFIAADCSQKLRPSAHRTVAADCSKNFTIQCT